MTNEEFIKKIAPIVKELAPQYDIKVCSPIIAQACLESNYGRSKLAAYNNFFGLKAGKSWRGDTVKMPTKEEIDGKLLKVNAIFRAFKSVESGIKGYFDFINTMRYQDLKGETNPKKYLEKIKKDGYATASNYVSFVYNVIEKYNLTQYDSPSVKEVKNDPVDDAIEIIAKDIIKNTSKWGNGEVRKQRIYTAVQTKVNQLLR